MSKQNQRGQANVSAAAVASGELLAGDSCPDFPSAARAFLNAFYDAKGAVTEAQKCEVLKEANKIQGATIHGNGCSELKVLEFYELTKRKII